MTFLVNLLYAYLLFAALLFVFNASFAFFIWWKDPQKSIYSDPAELLLFLVATSLFWIVFLKSFIKGLLSGR